jgi:hypothetical protein
MNDKAQGAAFLLCAKGLEDSLELASDVAGENEGGFSASKSSERPRHFRLSRM